ncbi:hypothetical protein TSUD_64100 [Trifolium subterraneum]|uniref:Replication protein A 70 kDa DNA-binding subunit B/D first OB fold domain-containing protein n=1 Tax=Trifolium subterraneum TaxID=3900 RepID=A0A2Z6N8A0_TRISU|nr:hypothetical protein TSUD_64100 [Trifolium subterraneum]
MWLVYKGDMEDYIDMLIRDIKGNTIQATINNSEIEIWKPLLKEGKNYFMCNFKVFDNDSAFKMTPHKYRLNFVGATKVDEIDYPGMPTTVFNFKDFAEIQAGNYEPNLLVDAIGFVEAIKKCVTASYGKKGNVAFTLKDLRDNVMDCTLWDGVYPLQLCNVWNGTKLLFDPTIPEIAAFISSIPKDVMIPTQHVGASYASQAFNQSYVGSQYSSDENFIKEARVLTIGAIKKLKALQPLHMSGFLPKGGFSEAVNSALASVKDLFHLLSAERDTRHPIRLSTTLLEQQKKIGLADPQDYPHAIDDIMERKFAFRVKWTTGWGGQGTVLHYKDSQELVEKIQELLPGAESSSKHITATQDQVVALTDSPPKQTFTQSDIEKFACLDDSILSTPNVSASADNDTSTSSQKTPAKRSAAKHPAVDNTNLEAQFSSTRSGKQIKKEKN